MNMKNLSAGVLFSAIAAAAHAQAPVAPTNAPGATTIDQDKRGTVAPTQTQRTTTTSTRPGAAPLPMNIKIQDEGIKMPACTAESREGEACKK